MDMFDQLHRQFFKQLFSISEKEKKEVARMLQEKGYAQDEIDLVLASLDRIIPSRIYGHAHAVDATSIIEQAFYQESARHLVLEVSADGDAENYDGHLNIAVKEVEHWD